MIPNLTNPQAASSFYEHGTYLCVCEQVNVALWSKTLWSSSIYNNPKIIFGGYVALSFLHCKKSVHLIKFNGLILSLHINVNSWKRAHQSWEEDEKLTWIQIGLKNRYHFFIMTVALLRWTEFLQVWPYRLIFPTAHTTVMLFPDSRMRLKLCIYTELSV